MIKVVFTENEQLKFINQDGNPVSANLVMCLLASNKMKVKFDVKFDNGFLEKEYLDSKDFEEFFYIVKVNEWIE
jgi:hypothetical protein